MKPLGGISVGDLVRGGSLHNWHLLGVVLEYRPNEREEFLVHWFAAEEKNGSAHIPIEEGFFMEERFYDLEKVS